MFQKQFEEGSSDFRVELNYENSLYQHNKKMQN